MRGIQANYVPQPAEWERCFIHFLSISQCEARKPPLQRNPTIKLQHNGQCLCHRNLLIGPQGLAQGLLQSLTQVRYTRVHRDKGNIIVDHRYKWGLAAYIT